MTSKSVIFVAVPTYHLLVHCGGLYYLAADTCFQYIYNAQVD